MPLRRPLASLLRTLHLAFSSPPAAPRHPDYLPLAQMSPDVQSSTVTTDYPADIDDIDKKGVDARIEETEPLVGRENLSSALPPSLDFWGYEQWDKDLTWTPKEEREVVRIADIWLMSMVCIMFLFLQLDRGNLSNATADGILTDLGLTTNDYNNGNTIQLIAFLACEFPSQMVVARIGFQRWLPFLMFCWGIVSCFQAFMTDRTGFYITRALIGAGESGFIPGAVLFTSYFYTSREMSIRLSFFWSTLNVARVLSALLAAGILKMRGEHGRPGWFWLFIIEGALTCATAIIAYFWLPSSPVGTKRGFWRKPWFTERQQKILVNRILRDDPAKGLSRLQNTISWSDIRETWADKHLWCLVFIGLVAYIPQNPVQGYLTLTLKRIGFSTFDSNMLSIPSAVLQIITMLSLSYSSDYFQERTLHCIFGEIWSLPLLIALGTMSPGGKNWERFALTTLIAGYPYFHPIVSAWISENTFSVKKRSVSLVTYNVVVQMGAVIGSQIFRADDAPWYLRGYKVLISICCLAVAAFAFTWWFFGYENAKKEKIWSQMSAEEREAYQADLAVRERDGSKRLDFRLTR